MDGGMVLTNLRTFHFSKIAPSNGEMLYFKYNTTRTNLPEATVKAFEEYALKLHSDHVRITHSFLC